MSVSKIIISILLFCGVITGMVFFYADVSEKYSLVGSTTDYTFLNTTTALQNKVKDMENITRDITQNTLVQNIFDVGALFTFKLGGLILDTSGVLTNVISQSARLLPSMNIPTWFTGTLIAIVLLFILFQVLSAALKKDL